MNALEIKGVSKRFGNKEVLKELDLSVPRNSIFGFVGKNGAGKTTTMKMILGLLSADSGSITVCGEAVRFGETKTNRNIGYLPDVPAFYGYMNAREYLKLCGESLGMSQEEITDRTEELLALVGLSAENHRIKGYSRGMKQRLGIAQALFGRPELLICDEPTSALDPVGRREVLDILSEAAKETTVIFSTHILSDVERICTDIAFLNDGKIVLSGKLSDIKKLKKSDTFIVEPENTSDAEILLANLPNATIDGSSILFSGDENALFTLFELAARERISLVRVERLEYTLEKLFMEVAV